MSASLVGSEMCIRDRGSASFSGALAWPVLRRFPHCFRSWRRTGAALGAVSYTHLTLPTICSV
eukprot:5975992-Alexandrium_andersonii.AAC.1